VAKKRLSKSSLLWFVRSRSYVTVADVRRRFGIGSPVGADSSDEVTAIEGPAGRAFVGLPAHQARLLQELWQEGKVGLELATDIKAPTVTGIYGIYQRGERPAPPPDEDGAEDESAATL
jgi:hypothetical protein